MATTPRRLITKLESMPRSFDIRGAMYSIRLFPRSPRGHAAAATCTQMAVTGCWHGAVKSFHKRLGAASRVRLVGAQPMRRTGPNPITAASTWTALSGPAQKSTTAR